MPQNFENPGTSGFISQGRPLDPDTTKWSQIPLLRDPEKQKAAMTVLLSQFEGVIRWRLAKDEEWGGDGGPDVYHDFVFWVMEKNRFASAERERGQFRCFLSVMLTSFLISRLRARATKRRGGLGWLPKADWEALLDKRGVDGGTESESPRCRGITLVPLEDVETHLAAATSEQEVLFDREWARNLLKRAMVQVDNARGLSEEEVVDRTMSYGNTKLVKELGAALRLEVSMTSAYGLIDEELKYLFKVLGSMQSGHSLERTPA